MKLFMVTDLEGPAMVMSFEQLSTPEGSREAMELLTGEVNAAVDGALAAAPDAEIVVWDAHGPGGIVTEQLHHGAVLAARNKSRLAEHLDDSFDAMLFVGQHAMEGTPDAPLCHTYWRRVYEYHKLNGRLMGEFGCRAAVAGALNVPTIFVAGDDKAVAEARALVPNIHGAVTKIGLAIDRATSLSPDESRALIRRTAKEAVAAIGDIGPLRIKPPYELEVGVKQGKDMDILLKRGAKQINDRAAVYRTDSILDLWL